MKKIAIVTGATSGIGLEFAKTIRGEFADITEIWAISRRPDPELLAPIEAATELTVRGIALDLSDGAAFETLAELLAAEQPHVRALVCCSGFGKFAATVDTPLAVNLNMLALNCGGVLGTVQTVLPYLAAGDAIINVASVAAFQPIPYINVYAATKAFVLSYTRGLGRELAARGIRTLAVCPFWTKTKFFDTAIAKDENPVVKKYTAMYLPEQIVRRAWRDLARGKDVSKFGFVARTQALLAKLLPHRFVMWFWMRQQSL